VTDLNVKERHLRGPMAVQVLDVEDIGRSRWSQVEAIEAQERGEKTKGREIIRVVDDENDTDPSLHEGHSSGPHKLLLQDAAGTAMYAMVLSPVDEIGVQMSIGTKMVLTDCVVARGVLLLEPKHMRILGGKVDAWDRKWREDRKQVLKTRAGAREDDG